MSYSATQSESRAADVTAFSDKLRTHANLLCASELLNDGCCLYANLHVRDERTDGQRDTFCSSIRCGGFFKDNAMTGGDMRLQGHGRRSPGALRGSDFPSVTMQYVYTAEHQHA